ncbi:MAG: hypothetical protein ACOY46_15885 [Bacillota bacterium]
MQNISEIWSVYRIAALYIGAVIGAGFASGQEILQFFIIFMDKGFWGIVLATTLFSYLGGLVMFISVHVRSTNYTDIYRITMGKIPGRLMDFLSLVMLPGGLVVMLAGGNAVFSEHLGLPGWLGTLLIALITILVLSGGLKGVITANAALVPVKVVAILLICSLSLLYSGELSNLGSYSQPGTGNRVNWLWSSILYVSYNMVVPVAVLSSLGRTVSYREGVTGGALGGLLLGVVTGLVFYTGLNFYPEIIKYEVPLLYIAGQLGPVVKFVLGLLIWMAILTTAIADAHGFASRFAQTNSRRYKNIGIAAVLLAVPLSSFKFSLLVRILYPLFGYVGLILLFGLMVVLPVTFIRRKFYKTV